MKAMILETPADVDTAPLRSAEVPVPQPGPGQVRLRVRACGVCRTDLHVVEGELPQQRRPLIPGHQTVGVVDALGAGCTRLQAGQRAGAAWLRETCGQCDYCRVGRENLCPASRYNGYQADGGYAQYAVVPEAFAYPLPGAFDDVAVAPLLCAGIIGYRALRRCEVPAGGTLALYGFGASAHVVLQLAVHRGHRVYVVTRGAGHQRLARELGAAWAGDDARAMPGPAHGAILFAPVGTLVPPALEMLRPGGTLALAGIYMTPVPELDYQRHLYHERDVHPVTANTRADGHELLAEAARVPVRTHTVPYPLHEANRALQDLKHGRVDGAAVLVVE